MTVSAAGEAVSARCGFARIRFVAERHPEWWTLALCFVAWIILGSRHRFGPAAAAFCGRPGGGGIATLADGFAAGAGAVAMIGAMMLPLVVVPVRRAACASLWQRRHRAIGGFLIGYGAVWALAIAGGTVVLIVWPSTGWTPVSALAAAALWEATPLKRRALSLCHRTMPLRPRGWRADVDCLRYGVLHGRACVTSCWAMMLAAMAAPLPLAAMAFIAALSAMERYWPRRRQRIEALALAGAALGCTAFVLH
jgi:hypothetical protein